MTSKTNLDYLEHNEGISEGNPKNKLGFTQEGLDLALSLKEKYQNTMHMPW